MVIFFPFLLLQSQLHNKLERNIPKQLKCYSMQKITREKSFAISCNKNKTVSIGQSSSAQRQINGGGEILNIALT